MKLLIVAPAFALLLGSGFSAYAQSTDQNSSTTSVKDAATGKPEGKTDIDDEITNARLRAVTGAKSAWSFSSNFNYAGSSLLNPFSSTRPQLNSQNSADPTNINGQMAVKYRLTEHDSLLLGFGVQYTPSYTGNSGAVVDSQTTASQPYIDYDRAFRVGSAQHVVDVTLGKYTLGTDISGNLNWSTAISDQVMFDVKGTKLEIGAAVSYGQDIYSGQAVNYKSGAVLSDSDYIFAQFAFEPVAEYAVSDKVSLRTVYRMLILNENPSNRTVWTTPDFQSESFGVGYGVTRDIYLYPNVQWSWSHIATDATTVGFTANINL